MLDYLDAAIVNAVCKSLADSALYLRRVKF